MSRPALDGIFRSRRGRLVGALLRALGPARLELAEECVQEAFAAALVAWPTRGVPADPTAWLLVVARNRARDALRREGRWEARAEGLARLEEERLARAPFDAGHLRDDELAMLFGCAHPSLAPVARITLMMKVVVGLSTEQIARVLLEPPATTAQRIARAKAALRDRPDAARIPEGAEAADRVADVRDALYLQFTAGHHALGDAPVADDLVEEAIRLCRALLELPAGDRPDVQALLALFLLVSARAPGRWVDGRLVPLRAQDRSRWDRGRIHEGLARLAASATGPPSWVHLEAGIAAVHAVAPSWAETDHQRILDLYGLLRQVADSPVVQLAEAVAAGAQDPAAGLAALGGISGAPEAAFHAARAELADRAGRTAEAREAWAAAAAHAANAAERAWYLERAGAQASRS